jgi:hypothetical protein
MVTAKRLEETFAHLVSSGTLPPVEEGYRWALNERSSVYGAYRFQVVKIRNNGGAVYEPFGSRYYTASGMMDCFNFLSSVEYVRRERS